MRRDWEPEDLVASWTLVEQDERELVAYKRGATRLGFALMLKFFEIEARFPRHASEFPPAAVAYVARQVDVAPTELGGYEWVGRTAEYHRSQIRRALGFRRFSEDDEAKLAGWLAEEIAPVELSDERLREALLVRCRSERIEPPARVDRSSEPHEPRSATASRRAPCLGCRRRPWLGWRHWPGSEAMDRTRPAGRGWQN